VEPQPEVPSVKDRSAAGDAPSPLPAATPPLLVNEPPLSAAVFPPPLPPQSKHPSHPVRHWFAIGLSLFIGLFLADAVVSLVDDSSILLFEIHVLSGIRGVLAPSALLVAAIAYGLMGLTPIIPKRVFLPLVLFNPFAALIAIPILIYSFGRIQQAIWAISFGQVILGLGLLYKVQGRFRFRWPIVGENQLLAPGFSWRNLCVFLLANGFVLLPLVAVYLFLCASLAVDHFSEGFLALRPEGLKVQARKYVRNDGKAIQLVPMSHIGEPDFYRKLSRSFPTNSIILMEGVSDDRNLLTNKISYKRMAASLGVAEQQAAFKPSQTKMIPADVDVEEFASTTIDFLNLATLIHSKGANAETVQKLMQYSESSYFQDQLFNDLLRKRNRHLLKEIETRLAQPENIIVPWGAAHMPEIGQEIQKLGFRVVETQEYVAIRFRFPGTKRKSGNREN
jgi:hypothetical protein